MLLDPARHKVQCPPLRLVALSHAILEVLSVVPGSRRLSFVDQVS